MYSSESPGMSEVINDRSGHGQLVILLDYKLTPQTQYNSFNIQYNLYKWGARDSEYPDTHSPVIISSKKASFTEYFRYWLA